MEMKVPCANCSVVKIRVVISLASQLYFSRVQKKMGGGGGGGGDAFLHSHIAQVCSLAENTSGAQDYKW